MENELIPYRGEPADLEWTWGHWILVMTLSAHTTGQYGVMIWGPKNITAGYSHRDMVGR
jgi:hypothetical protein